METATALTIGNILKEQTEQSSIISQLRKTRPKTRQDLKNYVKFFLGLTIPDKVLCPGHSTPMDYLVQTFFVDFDRKATGAGDSIVWANRGGGKTEIAAIATLLDCLFKPGCQVRILGGSLEQSNRMYDYLKQFTSKGFEQFLAGPVRKERCAFENGSAAEVLAQSATSVRGQHINKLRCDEIELFDSDVFAAAKFITHSTENISAAMETISTMHRPYGLMQKLIESAPQTGSKIFKWCLWETIEKCSGRTCSQCPLLSDCRGRAKDADGYLKIDDCITAMKRSSRTGWLTEMLCERPSLENAVFDEFDPGDHVRNIEYDPSLPLYRTLDFGFINPFVCLWIQIDDEGIVRVIDEYQKSKATIAVHAEQLKKRTPCNEDNVTATFCDPAGAGVNDVTGTSAVRELRQMGINTRSRKSGILQGIELVRRAIKDGSGQSRLIISPKCVRLIEAMRCYHYPEGAVASELPVKDGIYDHPIDALRYFFVNLQRTKKVPPRKY